MTPRAPENKALRATLAGVGLVAGRPCAFVQRDTCGRPWRVALRDPQQPELSDLSAEDRATCARFLAQLAGRQPPPRAA